MPIIELPKPIEFEWDEGNKNKSFIKHQISNEEAEQAFFSPAILMPDPTHSMVEDRSQLLGATKTGKILLISFTVRSNKIRIISARPADKYERNNYEKETKKNP